MKLVEIDLSTGDRDVPPISDTKAFYLVEKKWSRKEAPSYYVGKFEKIREDLWHFACGWGASGGFQYDKPGYNCSSWVRCWQLVDTEG